MTKARPITIQTFRLAIANVSPEALEEARKMVARRYADLNAKRARQRAGRCRTARGPTS